ncbi:MAG: MBL fold metallo-hydrolase [Bacillota bacterium]|nr:MBL fold metallo-hydrolase [Bacillota bacterium]
MKVIADISNEYKEDFLKFLGTAGARFVVSTQLRSSGGLWLSLGGEDILIDPGPGSLLKCLSSRPKLDPPKLSGIILTHRHLDHSNDVNILIEAMTVGGRNKKGFVYAPRDAFESADPVIQIYVQSFLEKTGFLEEGGIIKRPSYSLATPVRHQHPVETYGLRFFLPYGNLSIISDTAFFPSLIDNYKGSDILILNVVVFQDHVDKKIYHLNFNQAAEIIEGINPKVAILTHFGMTMLQQKPFLLAQKLQSELGIKVLAASDGMKLGLASLVGSD